MTKPGSYVLKIANAGYSPRDYGFQAAAYHIHAFALWAVLGSRFLIAFQICVLIVDVFLLCPRLKEWREADELCFTVADKGVTA